MIQNNLVSILAKLPKNNKKNLKKQNQRSVKNMKIVDPRIVNKSAQDFIDSIMSGNLYQELKIKDLKLNNITRI